MIPANLLQIPITLILRAALSIGPIIVIYGFAAACKIESPVPMIKSPVRKMPYIRPSAAGTNKKAPHDKQIKPNIIPLL